MEKIDSESDEIIYQEIDNLHLEGYYKKEKFFDVKFEPDNNLSIIQWIGYIPNSVIIQTYVKMGYFAKQNQWRITKSITDLSRLEGSFHQTNQWLLENFMPKAVERGFKYSAVVKSSDLYAQLALDDQDDLNNGLFESQSFDTVEEAYHWIIEKL